MDGVGVPDLVLLFRDFEEDSFFKDPSKELLLKDPSIGSSS